MPYQKSEDTHRRLLEAATADFSAHGIAGARVDRIAAAAGINKARLYAYFGDKDGLFDAVFRMHADAVIDAVPFTARDLAGYAVGLYDSALARPELVRLARWARLEAAGPAPAADAAAANRSDKLSALAQAQSEGHVRTSARPEDILALVISMALAWSEAALSGPPASPGSAPDHELRRQALAETVEHAFHEGPRPSQNNRDSTSSKPRRTS